MIKKFPNFLTKTILFSLTFLLIDCYEFFNTTYIAYINEIPIEVELAITPEERRKGLMKRKHLKENQGMLFVFEKEEYQHFWMKDTPIPLDIAFFDEEKFLIEVQKLSPNSEVIHTSSKPAKYALEMNQNWFEKKNIKPFAKLIFSKELESIIQKKSNYNSNIR